MKLCFFFYPPEFTLLFTIFVFVFLLLFMVRALSLPVKQNIFFLTGYATFYIILSFNYIKFIRFIFFIFAIQLAMTLLLAVVFAYALLGVAKTENIYRCTFCAAVAILCLASLGIRIVADPLCSFNAVRILCLIVMASSYLYWYEGKEVYIEATGQHRKFFNIGILPNIVGALTFFLYVFQIDINKLTYVWGLIITVSSWYSVSIYRALRQTVTYPDDAMICESLTEKQLDRMNRYAKHLKNANLLRKSSNKSN